MSLLAAVLAIAPAFGGARALAGESASTGDTSPGMRMYLDPQTGKVGVPPPSAQLQAREPAADMVRQAAPRLGEEPVTTAPGGIKVNLGDRYRAAVTRRIDAPAGTHQCVQSSAAPQ